MAILGTFILLVGWMGFNGGSTFAGTDFRLAVVITNTILASATGCLAAMFVMWRKFGKPDPSMTANGLLAGLVAITAPCAFVAPWGAAVIGIVAGVLVVVRSAQSRCTARTACGACSPSGCSPTARTVRV
jgi:Amt family ammonium transporter